MKKNIQFLMSLVVIAIALTACSGWFDVSPKTDVKAEEFFSNENGYNSALTGLYSRLTLSSQYKGDFTFGFMEKLAQRYDNYTQAQAPSDATRAAIYNYKETSSSKGSLNEMWLNSYRTIANANNLMSWMDKQGHNYIRSDSAYNQMYGEALAMRAFLHFDLLRCWGGCYNSEDSTAAAIPYRETFDAEKQPVRAANKVISFILRDLTNALNLLKVQSNINLAGNDLRYRLNYWAVEGLLARVYLYRGSTGDKTMAAYYANDVIQNSGLALVRDIYHDASMYDETLFAISCYKLNDAIKSYFSYQSAYDTQLYISLDNLNSVFETASLGTDDIRCHSEQGFYINSTYKQCMLRKFIGGADFAYGDRIPLLRLSEMYYIMCECSSLDKANNYINEVRNARGIPLAYNLPVFTTDADRTDALNKEYQKDFFGEGQYFFFLKRNKMTTFYRCPLAEMPLSNYKFAWPDNEVEFGWTTDLPDDK